MTSSNDSADDDPVMNEMPEQWRAWPARQRSRPPTPVLKSLNQQVSCVYASLAPGAPNAITPSLRRYLRHTYLRDPADLRRVRRYAQDHLTGIRATLRAAAYTGEALPLLGPEALLVLERLASDPLGLRQAWPINEPLAPLMALAAANGRPYWD